MKIPLPCEIASLQLRRLLAAFVAVSPRKVVIETVKNKLLFKNHDVRFSGSCVLSYLAAGKGLTVSMRIEFEPSVWSHTPVTLTSSEHRATDLVPFGDCIRLGTRDNTDRLLFFDSLVTTTKGLFRRNLQWSPVERISLAN